MDKFFPALLLAATIFLPDQSLARDLTIATLYAPPIAYAEQGVPTGFGVDIVTEALHRTGFTCTTIIVPWKRGLLMTKRGEVDGLFYTVKNMERLAWFHYPDEYLVMEATVMVKRRQDTFHATPDIHNYKDIALGIGRGYYYGPKLQNFINKSSFMRVEEANTIDLNFKKLLQGRIDMFLADAISATHFLRTEDDENIAEIVDDESGNPIFFDAVKSYLAFSKKTMSREETLRFSKVLRAMKQDGTYDAIMKRYQ